MSTSGKDFLRPLSGDTGKVDSTTVSTDSPLDESQKRAERDKRAMEIGALIVEGFKRMERDPEFLRGDPEKDSLSLQTLGAEATRLGLILRDGERFGRSVQGEVVAGSSQHVLVKVSDMVALSYERDRLDRAVSVDMMTGLRLRGSSRSTVRSLVNSGICNGYGDGAFPTHAGMNRWPF